MKDLFGFLIEIRVENKDDKGAEVIEKVFEELLIGLKLINFWLNLHFSE